MTRKTRSEAGRLGAEATLRKFGKNKLSEWGKLGGRPRKKKPKQETALVKMVSPEILPPPRQPETLPPSRQPDQAELIRHLVQKEVAEVAAQKDGCLWEPRFRSRLEADEIRRLQTVPQQRKWAAYYDRWGCFVCEEKERPHAGDGCCPRCRVNRDRRIRSVDKKLSSQNESRRERGRP